MNLFILSRRTQVFFEGREIRISYWHRIRVQDGEERDHDTGVLEPVTLELYFYYVSFYVW